MILPIGYRLTYYSAQGRKRLCQDFYGPQPWVDALRYMHQRYVESEHNPTIGPIFQRVS